MNKDIFHRPLTPEECFSEEELKEILLEINREEENRITEWSKAKEEIRDLIHPKYFDFAEDHETYESEGIVSIVEVEDRKMGYKSYPHCRELDTNDRRLYIKHNDYLETIKGESEYEGEDIEYWVWQTTGYCGDDYSGYLLLPMLDGRYWKINYSC